MSSSNDKESTWNRLRTARAASEADTTPEEHAPSPTMPREPSPPTSPTTHHEARGEEEVEDHCSHCSHCGRSTAAAKTQNNVPLPASDHEDKIASEFKGLHIDNSPSCICELPDDERDERVPTPEKEKAYGSFGSVFPSSEKPVGEGYDTDDYEDYPSTAPKSPREEGKPPAYPGKSPLATPSAELSTSPYAQEHAGIGVLPSPIDTPTPTPTISVSAPATPTPTATAATHNEGMHGEDIAFSRYAEEHKRLGDSPERVPVGVDGETRKLSEVQQDKAGKREERGEHEKKPGFVEKVAHLLKGDSKEKEHAKE